MRELKFRAWFNRFNKMVYEVDKDTFDLWKGYWNGKIHIVYPDDGDVVEQYTGLKDKNGKEIYEGDIIQEEIDFNSKMTDGTFKYRVYWDEEELCWCLGHIGNESIHHELWQCNQSTEVIGNIHENPELIGGKE